MTLEILFLPSSGLGSSCMVSVLTKYNLNCGAGSGSSKSQPLNVMMYFPFVSFLKQCAWMKYDSLTTRVGSFGMKETVAFASIPNPLAILVTNDVIEMI